MIWSIGEEAWLKLVNGQATSAKAAAFAEHK